MKALIIGTLFVIFAIVLAPFDIVSSIACIIGALLCIPLIWIELS